MSISLQHGLLDEARVAFAAADREGTAALNTLIVGGALVIASSVALVAVGGLAGVLFWLLVWLAGIASVALWLSPYLGMVRERRRTRLLVQHAVLEASRQRAVDLLLADATPDDKRRAAAVILIGDDSPET